MAWPTVQRLISLFLLVHSVINHRMIVLFDRLQIMRLSCHVPGRYSNNESPTSIISFYLRTLFEVI